MKTAGRLPKDSKKAFYSSEGFTQKAPLFANGHRILDLANQQGHNGDYTTPLADSMEEGQHAHDRSATISTSLERHKELEDEVKDLKATIKGIEGKRDELVQSARKKITIDEARIVITERLQQLLSNTYSAYLRADQRACIRAIENLWGKYAVTAKAIEAERDFTSEQLQTFLLELGYE